MSDSIDSKLSAKPNHNLGTVRHTQVRRDQDTVKTPSVSLYDIDFAIKSFIENVIKPKVIENDTIINVPILYMNSEKWSNIQKEGYIRDKKGKVMIPVIAFRRSSVSLDQQLKRNKVASVEDLYYLAESKYSKNFRYDQFYAQGRTSYPSEYYLMQPPDYVRVIYEFQFWCEYQSQLNDLIETMIFYEGQSFGDKNNYKFRSYANEYSIDNIPNINDDRLVRATFNVETYGYLVKNSVHGEVVSKRRLPIKAISFEEKTVSNINQINEERKSPINDKKYYSDSIEDGDF